MDGLRAFAPAVAVLVTATAGWAPTAGAAYRYWTYWTADAGAASWTFAAAGPASLLPPDGSVQGWRFAVTTTAGASSAQPQVTPAFAEICAGTPASPGHKRVALVIDPGTAADAPPGQQAGPVRTTCVVAEPDATGYQVLRSVVAVRAEGSGLICGIDGYPTGECASVVEAPSTPASSTPVSSTPVSTEPAANTAAEPSRQATSPEETGTPWVLAGVLAVAAAIGVIVLRRRPRG